MLHSITRSGRGSTLFVTEWCSDEERGYGPEFTNGPLTPHSATNRQVTTFYFVFSIAPAVTLPPAAEAEAEEIIGDRHFEILRGTWDLVDAMGLTRAWTC
jgi:hypothetical protein